MKNPMSRTARILVWALGGIILLALALAMLLWRWTLQFEQVAISEDLHLIYSKLGGNVAVLGTGEGAVVIDTLTLVTQGRAIRERAEALTGEAVEILVNTHWHADHTHGNPAFGPDIRVVSTARTKAILETLDADFWQGDAAGTSPNETFQDAHVIRLGDKTIELYWPGAGHTGGDLVALFREERAIHMGDLLFTDLYPFVDLETGGSVQAWSTTLDRVLELDFDHVIPGHGRLTDRDGLVRFRDFVAELAMLARTARQNAWTLEETIARSAFSEPAARQPLKIGPVTLVDREFAIQRAWEEVHAAFDTAAIR